MTEMEQMTIHLLDDQRPVLYFGKEPRLTALLDTGALFPVWVKGGLCLSGSGAAQA